MTKDSHITNTKAALESLHKILNSLPSAGVRLRLSRFALANSDKPLKEFLATFEREEADRTGADKREQLRRQKVLTEAGEILGMGPNDVIAKLTGTDSKSAASTPKK